jgi:hypothetical protein
VAEDVVVFDNVPPPLTVQVTPAEFLSLVTVAVSVTASAPSTVVGDGVTATPTGWTIVPQPVRLKTEARAITTRTSAFRNIEHPWEESYFYSGALNAQRLTSDIIVTR